MELSSPKLVLLGAGHSGGADPVFLALLALAGVGSAVVLALALTALVQRRSRSYLLVTLALATLLARTAVAVLSLTGSIPEASHHLLEHGLDAVMAALVVAAVYDARSVRKAANEREEPPLRSDGGSESVGGEFESAGDGSESVVGGSESVVGGSESVVGGSESVGDGSESVGDDSAVSEDAREGER